MTKHIFLLLVTLLVATTLASPISRQSLRKRSFKIPVIRNANYVAHGPKALARAYAKFGLKEPSPAPAALHKRSLNLSFGNIGVKLDSDVAKKLNAATNSSTGKEDGETSAVGTSNDAQFLSPVKFGGQELVVNFDSGSSDTWVFNTGLSSTAQAGHTIYDPTKSSSFQQLQGESFQISYGDGSTAAGPVGIDTMDIGGATVEQQAIGLPSQVSQSFVTDSASNGLVGLAFSKLNTMQPTQQKTFFDNVLPDLTQPVFTAQLLGDKEGSYEFGNIDTSSFSGQLNVVPVDSSKGFWQVSSTSASVNGQQVQVQGGSAIIDTGTSLMLVNDAMLQAYWSQVQGATSNEQVGGVIFPCNSQLPDLQVAIGDKTATVAGKEFNFAAVGTDTESGESFCFGGMQSNGGMAFSIYGDVFLKSNFVVFEGTTPSLGFAPHA